MNTRKFSTNDLLSDPFFIGFDSILNKIDTINRSNASNYPPYNLIKTGEDTYIIELAVAGFKEEDFDIEVHIRELQQEALLVSLLSPIRSR